MARATTSSNGLGSPGSTALGTGGGWLPWAYIFAMPDSAGNGTWPVSAW